MARTDDAQLNIRSRFARERAIELARRTGMTATRAAVIAGARAIVTWNTGHLRSLFPGMTVETPEEHLTRCRGEAAT